MRVSQIQNLTWAGNVLVLAGLVWVGLQFLEVNKQKKIVTEYKWVPVKAAETGSRWPGEISAFAMIWNVPVSGKVPPPPTPPVKEAPKLDRAAEFIAKVKYVGGWESVNQPDTSMVRINFAGKEMALTPGYSVDGFQLKQFSLVDSKTDPLRKTARLVFRHPEGAADVVIEQAQPQTANLADPANVPFKKGYSNAIQEGRIGPDHVEQQAFQNSKGEWVIPRGEAGEQIWIEEYGESRLWSKLATKPDVDAAGVSHGLRIMAFPESGTPLAPSHGIGQGDIVRSINGAPITSKDDITNYLRGDGKGLERYEVVVETDGAKRTVVYIVPRTRRAARD